MRGTTHKAALALFGAAGLCAASLFAGPELAQADPCGMVPPLSIPENQIAIERIGAQRTYVSHYRGVETMVLRPGFKGSVDEFGMLIPFPSPPAIRKVDDDIFSQLEAAIDPPEVEAHVLRRSDRIVSRSNIGSVMGGVLGDASAAGSAVLDYNTVRVVNREAVGMYDVAVLEAGSTVALKRWMDDYDFRYPKGMEDVTQDYVDAGWFFVAIKTQVGQKDGVNPRPGLRKTNDKLPKGATFTGAVQGMGFRFKSKQLVVPMRLSAFNKGKKRNIVYVLTDKPVRIKDIPKQFVKRQVRGTRLYKNLTGPLPLRVYNGTYKQLRRQLGREGRKELREERDPQPHNGIAKELIASDMLAIRNGRLANPVEDTEKELLAIGEALDLRGKQLDEMHRTELAVRRGKAERNALRSLRSLSLTVIDGEFSAEVIARQNLTFARYAMPARRNNRRNYDAEIKGPGQREGGRLYRASLGELDAEGRSADDRAASVDRPRWRGWLFGGGLSLGLMILFGGFIRARSHADSSHRRDGVHRSPPRL